MGLSDTSWCWAPGQEACACSHWAPTLLGRQIANRPTDTYGLCLMMRGGVGETQCWGGESTYIVTAKGLWKERDLSCHMKEGKEPGTGSREELVQEEGTACGDTLRTEPGLSGGTEKAANMTVVSVVSVLERSGERAKPAGLPGEELGFYSKKF